VNIKATIIEHAQGSEAWLQHRAKSLNASDLAAAMGLSPYLSRADLIKRIATGIVPEVDAATQRRFDKGHEVEAAARPLAEEIIGESLYPVVLAAEVDGLYLSASLDGIDVMDEETWEHKQLNAELEASLDAGVIPEQYHPQMEQGLMLANAKRCLFMASNGDRESMRCCWYESNPELRAKIIPTWKQLMADAAAYVPTAAEVKPTGKAPEALPALHIVINGGVSASNLDEFKETALGAIRSVNRELTTDVHFADAEKAVKWCSDIEDRIKAAKDHALSQTASIDALFKTMDEISAEARRVRLDLDKLVKARKEAIKGEIVAGGVAALAKYIRELNASMPADYMPTVPADFGGCIKGLRTVDSIRNAVDTELARAKIHASEIANLIRVNVGKLDAANAPMLFADIKTLVLKRPDDLAAIIALRVAAEAQRKEAERERIRAEETARLEREAASKAAAEKAEADRVERERTQSAIVEVERKAREQQEAVSAQHIRDEQAKPSTPMHEVFQAAAEVIPSDWTPAGGYDEDDEATDNGARLTLGQINERLSPVSITVAGLSELGYEPVAVVKAARMYPASKFKAICQAISAHVLAAATEVVA
jgi:putative phage-type endonuclease